jgi:hypothetical protein
MIQTIASLVTVSLKNHQVDHQAEDQVDSAVYSMEEATAAPAVVHGDQAPAPVASKSQAAHLLQCPSTGNPAVNNLFPTPAPTTSIKTATPTRSLWITKAEHSTRTNMVKQKKFNLNKTQETSISQTPKAKDTA